MTFQQTTTVERSIIQYNDNNNMIIENDIPLQLFPLYKITYYTFIKTIRTKIRNYSKFLIK